MTDMTDRVCNGWDKVLPILSGSSRCLSIGFYSLLGLYAVGKYTRVADIRRLEYLRLVSAPLGVVSALQQQFYKKFHARLPSTEAAVAQTTNVIQLCTCSLAIAILLHDSRLISLGKYASLLDRGASALATLAMAGNIFIGARCNWFRNPEDRAKSTASLLLLTSGLVLTGLSALTGRYSLNFAAAKALVGIPNGMIGLFLAALSIRAQWKLGERPQPVGQP